MTKNGKRLFLMVGIPGSGKSTWVKKTMAANGQGHWVSRDTVRYSILAPGEEYFSHEDEVFDAFVKLIQKYIDSNDGDDIYVDATHITVKSRNKVLCRLRGLKKLSIIPVVFKVSLQKAKKNNSQREGIERTPDYAITNMFYRMQEPTFKERYKYEQIWAVGEDGYLEEVNTSNANIYDF